MELTRRDFLKTSSAAAGAAALGVSFLKEEAMAKANVANAANTAKAQNTMDQLFSQGQPLSATDPEFAEFFGNFAFDEVKNQNDLNEKDRYMAILATLLGCQGTEAFQALLPAALDAGVTPVAVREIVYQGVAYLGLGRVLPFLHITNNTLQKRGVQLPLEKQGTSTPENRREKGTAAQVLVFGEGMQDFWKSGPEEIRHINQWLAANCFGDYYTRRGLDLRERELVTFCFLAAQGGCEPQLVAHARGNFKTGNDRAFLIKVISQCLPYIGYPRTLNALRCVNEAAGAKAGS